MGEAEREGDKFVGGSRHPHKLSASGSSRGPSYPRVGKVKEPEYVAALDFDNAPPNKLKNGSSD